MKKLVLLSTLFLCFSYSIQAQKSHLSVIHDFDGKNFDYSVVGMVGMNDSLYVISFTPNRHGMFFRIDGNGDGYKVIWEFDDVNYEPNSIVGNDKAIYITTRFSGNYGGALFKYSLEDYSFTLLRDFSSAEIQEVNVKYVTDSVLWYTSLWSPEDAGSVFSTNLDGSEIKKIYSATNAEETSMPSNFFFHENKVYIALWGGGNLDGNSAFCGSFIRINTDGSGYEKIIPGSEEIGTQPQSLIIRDNKLIGLFAYSGSASWSGRVFRSNLDGSDYESLGAVGSRSLTKFLSTQSLIYGVSTYAIYGINPQNAKIQIYDDFQSNPDFGWDVVSDPVYLNGDVFIAAQQGGPNEGGTILKWLNARPEVHVRDSNEGGRTNKNEIDLQGLFVDPNEDPLTFSYEYDHELITLSESNGILTLTPLTSDTVEVKITVTDGWAGYAGARIRLNPFEIKALTPGGDVIEDPDDVTTSIDEETFNQKSNLFVFPNPTNSILKLSITNVELLEIFAFDGTVYKSFSNPEQEVDISSFRNGFYIVRAKANGKSYWQKIIKN
jgi:hypothetical protein